MRIRIFLFILLIIIGINCSNSTYKIVDYFEVPFELIRPTLVFPDSLGGAEAFGQIGVEVEIDSNYYLIDYKVLFINIESDLDKFEIEYRYNVTEYSKIDISRYLEWVDEYLKSCKFKPKSYLNDINWTPKWLIPIPVNKSIPKVKK